MRWLAVARLRFLISLRSTGAIGGVFTAVLLVLMASSFPIIRSAMVPRSGFLTNMTAVFRDSTLLIVPACLIHLIVLAVVSASFGIGERRASGGGVSDLGTTAPVTPASLFTGDALGIFAATMAVHACVVPLIAVLAALTPLPSGALWRFEAVTLLTVFLASCGAAWALRAENWRMSLARSFRGIVVFALATTLVAGAVSRSPRMLSDAWVGLVSTPGPRAWAALLAALRSPALAAAALAALYVSFILFFLANGAREPRAGSSA